MSIQDLLEKVAEKGVSLWDMKSYTFTIMGPDGDQLIVKDIKIDSDNRKIKLKLE